MADNQDGFRQDAAFYYLTGLENAAGALLVIDSRRHDSWLFIPPPGQLRRFGGLMHPPYGYVEAGQSSAERLGLDHVVFWDEFAAFVDRRLAEDPSLTLLGPFSSGTFSMPAAALAGQRHAQSIESRMRL